MPRNTRNNPPRNNGTITGSNRWHHEPIPLAPARPNLVGEQPMANASVEATQLGAGTTTQHSNHAFDALIQDYIHSAAPALPITGVSPFLNIEESEDDEDDASRQFQVRTTDEWTPYTSSNFTPPELRNKKFHKTKTIVVPVKIQAIVVGILENILKEYSKEYEKILYIKLDFVKSMQYNELGFLLDENREGELLYLCRGITNGITYFTKGGYNLTSDSSYMKLLEQKALEKYDIEHSVYRYYPRLKDKVKYGDAEILKHILSITKIGVGTIKWE